MKPARDDISDPDPTEALPQVGPEVEHTRVIAVLSGTAKTRRDTPARALRLRFPGGEIVPVEPGYRLRLGRDPQMCPR